MTKALAVGLLLIFYPLARADQPAAPPAGVEVAPAPTTSTTSEKAAPAEKPNDPFQFDLELPQAPTLAGQANSLTPEKLARLESQVRTRRKVLKAHLYLGIATLAAMAATLVIGQLDYYDKFSSAGTYTRQFTDAHEGLAISSTVLFTSTALLGLFAPQPYPKKIKADAALAHKIFMGIATAGMLAQLILGPISASRSGTLQQRDLATTHLVLGYTTFAAMAAGTLAFVF